MNYNLQKIVSLTTRNNIKLVPLAFEYVKSFAGGIGMSKEKKRKHCLSDPGSTGRADA